MTQLRESCFNAIESFLGVLDRLLETTRGQVKDDTKFVVCFCNLARRERKEVGLEFHSFRIV